MQRNQLCVIAVVLAVSISAFSNVKLKETKHYYHIGNAFYETYPPGATCQEDDVCCELEFNGINLPSGAFSEDNIPSSPDYIVTRFQENASLQE